MSLSRKDIEELKPHIEKAVKKFLGFTEPTLATAALNCLDKGYDKRKTVDKLGSILDDSQAAKFAEKLFNAYDDFRSMSRHDRSRKRKEERRYEESTSESKRPKVPEPANPVLVPEPGQPSPGQLTADKIKQMMANAQKEIRERKAQLNVSTGMSSLPAMPSQSQQALLMQEAQTKARQAADLQARIQAQLANAGISQTVQTTAIKQVIPSNQPTPLILDEQGRTIDAKTGETIQLTHHMPTLKANIRAKKREQFKAVHEKPPEEITESRFFDPRVSGTAAVRQKRGFKFHEQGKYEQLGARMRTKAILDKLHNEISASAKKTGIASAARLATITPKRELKEGDIPDVEWWDDLILINESYDNLDSQSSEGKEMFDGVTRLVEHPIQIKPPDIPEGDGVVQIPVMLTKKERKKLRRQNRNEGQKELQEKIRLGLIPPPEPKVRMANLMRVLGTEAVQDPTKVEAHVRAQMAKRQKEHEESNAARKLTKDQRREKKSNKLKEDTSLGVHVAVYRIRDLSNQAKKFKVETNANQLFMTGLVVLHRDCNVVVVEGGPKQQKKFQKLMLHRIKWEEDTKKKNDKDSDDEDDVVNRCTLIWEGTVQTRNFGQMQFKACPTESFAREQFRKHSVEHYWNLAFSGAILETAGEEV